MFATHFFQHIHDWFAPLSRLTQPTTTPTVPVEQVIVQPGDAYFLAAGAYRVRVLTGQLWLPEHGILAAGAQRHLRVDFKYHVRHLLVYFLQKALEHHVTFFFVFHQRFTLAISTKIH